MMVKLLLTGIPGALGLTGIPGDLLLTNIPDDHQYIGVNAILDVSTEDVKRVSSTHPQDVTEQGVKSIW